MATTVTRRTFLKAGAAGAAATLFGFDLRPAQAQVRTLKIERTTETRSICPYCSVSCGVIIHTLGDRSRNVTGSTVVHVEGDPDSPINRGTLCPKGAALRHNINSEKRLTKVLYRAPGSDRWEEKSWEWALDTIARRFKQTRERTLRLQDAQGNPCNCLTSVGVLGFSPHDNEAGWLANKVLRTAFGIIPFETQARI